MAAPQERRLVGLDYLEAVTALLQRARTAHPTAGPYHPAEPQWWWSAPLPTDALGQLFWFDEDGRPEAAAIVVDWGAGSSAVYGTATLTPVLLPDAPPDRVAHVVERGLEHAAAAGFATLEVEVDRADAGLLQVLSDRGFVVAEDGVVECWIDVAARPEVSRLAEGYRLASRAETTHLPHPMADRRPEVAHRLDQTSLYRPDLDLVVLDGDDEPAAYALFWFDPVTATGVVEPMRTHDAHQRRGLGRHLLTAGLDRLARGGAERASICFEPENPASGPLYLSVGFTPHLRTDVLAGPTRPPT